MEQATSEHLRESEGVRFWTHVLKALLLAMLLSASSGQSATNELNLPIVFLESTNQIVSERKVTCTLSLREPDSSGATNRLPGIARVHGGVSQSYSKKSYGITADWCNDLASTISKERWHLSPGVTH